jgi:hypothetical protein
MGEIIATSLVAAIIIFCILSTIWLVWRSNKTKRIMRQGSVIIQRGNVVHGALSSGNIITSDGGVSIRCDEGGTVIESTEGTFFQLTSQGDITTFSLTMNGTHYLVRASGEKVLTLNINNQRTEPTSEEGKAALKVVGQFLSEGARRDQERCKREHERNDQRKISDMERQTRSHERETARILRERQRSSDLAQREYDRDTALVQREQERELQRINREYERETQSTKRDEERAARDLERFQKLFGE